MIANLRIYFDQDNANYEASSLVTGVLYLTPTRDLACKSVDLSLGWKSYPVQALNEAISRSALSKKDIDFEFTDTELKKGVRYEATFSFQLPDGPLSYQGEHFNVDWHLEANAQLSEGSKSYPVYEKARLTLNANSNVQKTASISLVNAESMLSSGNLWLWSSTATLLIAIALLYWIFPFQGIWNYVFVIAILVITAAIIFSQIAAYINNQELSKSLEKLEFKYLEQMNPGDALKCELLLKPKQAIEIEDITLQLKGEEFVSYKFEYEQFDKWEQKQETQKDTKVLKHIIYEKQFQLANAKTLAAGETFDWTGEFVLPENAAYSFVAQGFENKNKVNYELSLSLKLPNAVKTFVYDVKLVP